MFGPEDFLRAESVVIAQLVRRAASIGEVAPAAASDETCSTMVPQAVLGFTSFKNAVGLVANLSSHGLPQVLY